MNARVITPPYTSDIRSKIKHIRIVRIYSDRMDTAIYLIGSLLKRTWSQWRPYHSAQTG